MASQGSIIARVYTSNAFIPLPNAYVTFTGRNNQGNQDIFAIRKTNSSGITAPVYITTPDYASSQSPSPQTTPYSTINLQVSYPGFESVSITGIQIFPGVETIQDLPLQPIGSNHKDQSFDTPAQRL